MESSWSGALRHDPYQTSSVSVQGIHCCQGAFCAVAALPHPVNVAHAPDSLCHFACLRLQPVVKLEILPEKRSD
jgi:hypothetical protein